MEHEKGILGYISFKASLDYMSSYLKTNNKPEASTWQLRTFSGCTLYGQSLSRERGTLLSHFP